MAQLKAGTTVGGKPVVTEEFEGQVATHLADGATGAHKATNISFTPTNGMTSINVQQAVVEAFQFGNSRKEELVDALLLLDPSLPISYNSTWQEIFIATGEISTGAVMEVGVTTTMNRPGFSGFWLNVTGLPFKPSSVIAYALVGATTKTLNASFFLDDIDITSAQLQSTNVSDAALSYNNGKNANNLSVMTSDGFWVRAYGGGEYTWKAIK